MSGIPDFEYVSYLKATPEQVWTALTDRDITAKFWGHSQVSEWAVGSTVEHVRTDGSGVVDAAGLVTTVDRPHRLAFGFDFPDDLTKDAFTPSTVTFDIAQHRDIVRVTITHSGLRTAEERENIALGWPTVLSNLKTLLETGDVLPQAPWEFFAAEHAAAQRGA